MLEGLIYVLNVTLRLLEVGNCVNCLLQKCNQELQMREVLNWARAQSRGD
jgi:hypothetical protein